ncbi:MAG: O-antigen ligase family protein [Candidatus Aminicenantes bacterium]|nr:O-antigen ligase family protein [Candidatus Aminicenantes bacterium]
MKVDRRFFAVKPKEKNKQYFPFLKSSSLEDFNTALILLPFWWILGIKFFIFHLISLLGLLKILISKRSHKINIPREAYILILFIIIYAVAIGANLKAAPFTRILASLYNLTFWIMGVFILIIVFNELNKSFIFSFFKIFSFIGLITGIISLISIIAWFKGYQNQQIESLLGNVLNLKNLSEAQLLYASIKPTIVATDWILGRRVPRLYIFEVYPTAIGILMVFAIVITLIYYKISKKKWLKIALIFEGIALLASWSRVAILLAIVSVILINWFLNKKKNLYYFLIVLFLLIFMIISFVIPPSTGFAFLYEFRKSSSDYRTELYKVTLKEAMKKPILGHGIKPRIQNFSVPIGSHSMYLGVLLKTGFLGLCVFALFWIMVIGQWWNYKPLLEQRLYRDESYLNYLWLGTGIIIFDGLLWMFFEDLDAPVIVAFVYFLIVAIALSINKLKS